MLSAQPLHRLMRQHRQQAGLRGCCYVEPKTLINAAFYSAANSRVAMTARRMAPALPVQAHPGFRQQRMAIIAAANPLDALIYTEGYTEVEEVRGARLVVDSEPPVVEYLVKWKDGSEDTWEEAKNLSEDLVRIYVEQWWTAARKADGEAMAKMLAGGRQLLANAVDADRRSALHYAAALGKTDVTKLLLEAGAYPDLQDKDGYTPLHMAAGYMQTASMTALLEAGADPQLRDNTGKSTVALIDNLRKGMPLSPATVTRRLALEEVNNTLIDRLYEEVVPMQILDVRTRDTGIAAVQPPGAPPPPPPAREFLIQFADGSEDAWVEERDVSPAVLQDWEAGLEYAVAEEVLDVVQVGTERRFKIRWSDNYPVSWEPEEHVPPQLIALFQQQCPELFEDRTRPENSTGVDGGWGQEYQTQYRVGASPSRPSSSASAEANSGDSTGQSQQQQVGQWQRPTGHQNSATTQGANGNGRSGSGQSVSAEKQAVGAA